MNKKIPVPHPASFIDNHLVKTIRQFAAEAERIGSLDQQQLAAIYKNHWFDLYVPLEYRGLGLSLPDGLRITESLAWADGSTGWTVTLCSGANWFIGFLQPEIATMFFNNDKVCFAGSGRPSGIAKLIGNGEYEISGRWQYATGSAHASAFTANCHIEKDGRILLNDDGTRMIASFIFLRNEVSIHKDWKGMGMKATSSDSFEVNKVKVNKNRRFMIDENQTVLPGRIYKYPFLQFAESTLSVNISGMAIHFLDLFEEIIKERKISDHFTEDRRQSLLLRHKTAQNKQQEARLRFYGSLQRSWNESLENGKFMSATLAEVSKESTQLASTSRKVVDDLFSWCGLIAADQDSEINRVWRNLHTAILHPLLLQ